MAANGSFNARATTRPPAPAATTTIEYRGERECGLAIGPGKYCPCRCIIKISQSENNPRCLYWYCDGEKEKGTVWHKFRGWVTKEEKEQIEAQGFNLEPGVCKASTTASITTTTGGGGGGGAGFQGITTASALHSSTKESGSSRRLVLQVPSPRVQSPVQQEAQVLHTPHGSTSSPALAGVSAGFEGLALSYLNQILNRVNLFGTQVASLRETIHQIKEAQEQVKNTLNTLLAEAQEAAEEDNETEDPSVIVSSDDEEVEATPEPSPQKKRPRTRSTKK